jgi:hypothetical protein
MTTMTETMMLAGEIGVGRDRARRCEVQIALDGQPERPPRGGELVHAYVAEFRLS